MKNLRKFSSLALVLVLVCLCAASAFAVSLSDTEEYEGRTVEMTRQIDKYHVKGSVSLEYADNYENTNSGLERRVSIDVWYITEDASGRAITKKWSGAVSNSVYNRPGLVVEKTWTTAEINSYNITCLSYSNTVHIAALIARGTTRTYNSGSRYLAYSLQT